MKAPSLVLVLSAALTPSPASAACEDPFVWSDGADQVQVSMAQGRGFVRIGASEEQRMGDGAEWSASLYSHFRTDAVHLPQPIFWTPDPASVSVSPSLALAPPDVPTELGRGHNRIDFGQGRVIRDRAPDAEYWRLSPGEDGSLVERPRAEWWTYSTDLGESPADLGEAPLARFRDTGSIRVEHWGGSRWRPRLQTWARYDWTRLESLIQRARDHFAGCSAPAAE